MASAPASSLAEFAVALLGEREVAPRARLLANQVAELLPEAGISVYSVESKEPPCWKSRALAGDLALEHEEVPIDGCTLGAIAERREVVVFSAGELSREDYEHLNIKRSFSTLTYFPIQIDEVLLGVIEIVSYKQPLEDEELPPIAELADICALAFATALSYEKERNDNLQSVARLTELYDLELVFSATLDMDELMPIITSKIQQLADVQAVNLWLVVDDDKLLLANRAGFDLTCEAGTELKAGQGIPNDVSDKGESIVIATPEDDERLKARNGELAEGEGAIFTLMAVPLVQDGKVVGVLEAVNKMDGNPFDDDDLFLLTTVAEAAATSLHNASLITAERKVEILEALVKISTEITSTLDLDRVLKAVVNGAQTIIPYERAAITLDRYGKLEMKAVSGEEEVNTADPNVKRLKEMHEWAAIFQEEMLVSQNGDDAESIDEPDGDKKERFAKYFAESGVRSFYLRPLTDDQGRVGILTMESSEPGFLDLARLEVVKVLSGQATVALRNATLYREVPLIGLLEPILKKRDRFMAMEKRRRALAGVLALAAVVFLIAVPLPMRVDGSAMVAPAHSALIQPEEAGVVRRVLVHEGDPVTKGTILAEMEDWEARTALDSAVAKRDSAMAEMNQALAAGRTADAGAKRIEQELWTAEAARARARLEHTRLRSPIDGVVATPYVENQAGKHLEAGEALAEVTDIGHATVDVAVEEVDAALLEPGANASVKLEGFPTRTFRGAVAVVSPKLHVEGEKRFAYARVEVANPDGALRTGMQGRGKVSAGWKPAGYVIFRRLGMWAWEKLWYWFGW